MNTQQPPLTPAEEEEAKLAKQIAELIVQGKHHAAAILQAENDVDEVWINEFINQIKQPKKP